MKAYGNLMNRIAEHTLQHTPTVGMGATLYLWSDRKAGTVTKVSPSGLTAWIQEDRAIRTDSNGMSEVQVYRYEPNPSGVVYKATRRKNGTWKTIGAGDGVTFGERRAYHDFSF